MSVIRSRDNERVKRWAKLARDARLRRKEGRLLVEGPHLVQAAREAGCKVHATLLSESAAPHHRIAGAVVVADRIFAGIVDAETPPGIAAEISLPAGSAVAGDAVFLEGVQDPGNVGAIIRSAAAFGVRNIVVDAGCADPWSPKALRAGMGGHFRVAIDGAFAERLREFQGTLACTVVKGGAPLGELPGPIGWIFGGEGQGVSEATAKLARVKVTIPMAAGTESLNVAASAAICLYATFSRRAGGS